MTMDYLSIVWTGIYYIVYPVFYIILLILHILSIITAPLLHAGQYLVYACCWYPIHVLAKFEVMDSVKSVSLKTKSTMQTLYIFFGVAVLLGALTGTSLHYASAFLTTLFDIKSNHEEPRGRMLSSYRSEDQRPLDKDSSPNPNQTRKFSMSDGSDHRGWERSNKGRGSHRNVPNTILEEVDSTDDSF